MLGTLNPLPFRVGGGPTPMALAYGTLRRAVGDGGSAPNDRGIEGLWRRSEAKGLAAAASHCRRALVQSSPLLATDLLPYYERITGVVPETGSTAAQRRVVATARWTRRIDNSTQVLAAELLKIDPRLTLLESPHSKASTAQFGRSFAPHAAGLEAPTFELAAGHVQYPNYSTDAIVRVKFATNTDGVPLTQDEKTIVERARELLRDLLPSSTDFTICVRSWQLNSTPIGFGGLG